MFRFKSPQVKQAAAKPALYVTKGAETQGAIRKCRSDEIAKAAVKDGSPALLGGRSQLIV